MRNHCFKYKLHCVKCFDNKDNDMNKYTNNYMQAEKEENPFIIFFSVLLLFIFFYLLVITTSI